MRWLDDFVLRNDFLPERVVLPANRWPSWVASLASVDRKLVGPCDIAINHPNGTVLFSRAPSVNPRAGYEPEIV